MDESGADERVSRVLKNKWRLDRLLGRGGMGAVYEATHRNGMRAAVKVLRQERPREPGSRLYRMTVEIRDARQCFAQRVGEAETHRAGGERAGDAQQQAALGAAGERDDDTAGAP